MEPYIPEMFFPEVKKEDIEEDALSPTMFPDCTLGPQNEKDDDLILDDMKEEDDIKIEEEDVPPADPLMMLSQQGPSSEDSTRTKGENNTRKFLAGNRKAVVDVNMAREMTSNSGDMTYGSDNVEVGHGSKCDRLFVGATAEPPPTFKTSPESTTQPTKRQKVMPMQFMGDSPMVMSCPPQQFVHADHQNFQSMVLQPPGFFSDGQQNKLASHEDNLNCHSIFSTTPLPLPSLPSSFSTSVTTSTSSTFLHAQQQENLDLALSEPESSDDSNDQTSPHPDPILKVLKEKNVVFDRTIAMMVQEQERHKDQLKDMQARHKNQMKIMQEQHQMWLKMQEQNLNSILQIQQSQNELQSSIQQIWQNISNSKGQ